MRFTKAVRRTILLMGVVGIALAGTTDARADGFRLQNISHCKRDCHKKECCPPNGFFGYYPTAWRQWPAIGAEPAQATMTVLPPQTPGVEQAPPPMEVPPEKNIQSGAPVIISTPPSEPPFLPRRRGPTFLKPPVIQR